MPNATRSPRNDASPGSTLLEELAREVFALRAELADMRRQLATQVCTRRLVVVDESGFEGIVAEVSEGADEEHNASVRVASRTDAGTWAILHNTDSKGMDGRTVSCGLYISGGGNGVGMFEVHATELDRDDPGGEFRYDPRLDVIEDHGPRVSLDIEGLQFDR